MGILRRLGNLGRQNRLDAEYEAELTAHLEMRTADNISAGMSPEEARRKARIQFGNPGAVKERTAAVDAALGLQQLWRDVRYAFRTLARSPGFSGMALGVIAVCLGATTALFAVVRGVLLEPLPFRDPSQLVMVYEHFQGGSPGSAYNQVSPADYYEWRARTHGFQDMAAWRDWQFNLSGGQGELPEVVHAEAASWNLFCVLGVHPALGRTFSESEDQFGASRVAMLTWSLYQRRFGATLRSSENKFTWTVTPGRSWGYCPSGSPTPTRMCNCGCPTHRSRHRVSCNITPTIRAWWWRGCVPG